MKVAVTGGLGFIGRKITEEMIAAGMKVSIFARSADPDLLRQDFNYVRCDLTSGGDWQIKLAEHDAVINLAGANIFTRWNDKKKRNIYNSRIVSTANIAAAVSVKKSKVKVFINASAVGYYGLTGDREVSESDRAGADFLADVCSHWEAEARKAEKAGIRVVLLRFGTVLGNTGGGFPLLLKTFRYMMGARLGNGKQWFPWLHIDDAAGIIIKALNDKKMSGPYNCSAPGAVTNRDFTRAMGRNSGRPQPVPFVPVFMLRLLFGEFGPFLAGGQKILPKKLEQAKYKFIFPDIDSAIKDLIN